MEYSDLAALRNAFFQQAFASNYTLTELPQTLLGKKVCLQNLHNSIEKAPEHLFFTQSVSDRHTIISLRTSSEFPILGTLYSTTKATVNSRYRNTLEDRGALKKVVEVDLVNELSLPGTHLIVSTKERNFCTICGMLNESRTKKVANEFANLFVPREANQYMHYVRSLARLFPEKWVAYYADINLARKYLGPEFIRIINEQVMEFFNRIAGRNSFPFALNTKTFSTVQQTVKILCPGVVIGYLPALLIYGELLQEIMVVPRQFERK